jgi:chemotaxis response regulator CheB
MKLISSIDGNSLLKPLPNNNLTTKKETKSSNILTGTLPFSKKELKKKSFTVVAIGASAGGA